MITQGIKVYGFGAGEPDFNTPDYINNAAIEAIKKVLQDIPQLKALMTLEKQYAIN